MGNKIDSDIQHKLFSTQAETVISALRKVKERGNKNYLPLLFDLLNSQPDPEVEKEIVQLLSTVKDKESVNTFMRAVENEKYRDIRKTLLSACWQNGLDFGAFMPVFIDIIIADDWEIAFEAFTIVDNLEYIPGKAILDTSISKINGSLNTVNEQKRYFLQEILSKITA